MVTSDPSDQQKMLNGIELPPFAKILYIDLPLLPLWSSVSELSEVLPPWLQSSFSPNKTQLATLKLCIFLVNTVMTYFYTKPTCHSYINETERYSQANIIIHSIDPFKISCRYEEQRKKKDGRKISEVSETFKTTSIISIDYKVNLRGENREKAQKNKQQLKRVPKW